MVVNAQEKKMVLVWQASTLRCFSFSFLLKDSPGTFMYTQRRGERDVSEAVILKGTVVISEDILWLSQQELGDAMASSGQRLGMQ